MDPNLIKMNVIAGSMVMLALSSNVSNKFYCVRPFNTSCLLNILHYDLSVSVLFHDFYLLKEKI